MDIIRISAFSDGDQGGNPAGVILLETLPPAIEMQAVAKEVGFSETAFAAPQGDGWRVRYFAPESEVPFCGHATIALGTALARHKGPGTYKLYLAEAEITVDGHEDKAGFSAVLQSPPTQSQPAQPALVRDALALFGYSQDDLDARIPAAMINGGAQHLVLALQDRQKLAAMRYDLNAGRDLMNEAGLVTIMLVWVEGPQRFHVRNPFASGGVLEDPATGAAAAAFSGYLRDIEWPHSGHIQIIQGEDMGHRSVIKADIPPGQGASIRVSGRARFM